ncbi:ATP-binding protein [Drancourtella sp. An57]
MVNVSKIFNKTRWHMEIKRDNYLEALINRMHNHMIKVVTGVRRSGKSYLIFHIFRHYLLEQGIPESHIISIELDQRKHRQYRNPDVILEYIESCIQDEEMYYILLDEVQLLNEFEEVLNSLLHIDNADVYVTGSNSKFLSKDIITEFRGRGDEIHIFPLTFWEFMQVYEGDMYHGWADYILYGGLPLTVTMKTEEQKVSYLTRLFEETYLKDIIERHHIEKTQELEDLVNILASAIGSLTNVPKIEATFKSVLGSNISGNTIRQYIEYLEDAFIVHKANRYNVKGRKYIGTPVKYYFEDVGLRNARLGFRQVEETHLMENIIYNELRSRGYSVDVGLVEQRKRDADGKMERKQLEIDFVANMGSRRYYIQSAFAMSTEEKKRQEKASLLQVQDSFKKIIIVKEVMNVTRDENGITTMSIYDFLLKKNSLEL